MFHLFTHAFFKSLLFLSSGSVMHAMGNIIDMRRFGGLRKVLPITHVTFLCGTLSLASFPALSGFWSKDEILVAAWQAGRHAEAYGILYLLAWFTVQGNRIKIGNLRAMACRAVFAAAIMLPCFFFRARRFVMAARKLRSLVAHFESLADPRLERTRKHNLLDIIALPICAVISGADSWVAVEKYGDDKLPWLQSFLQLPNGIPSHDTIGRFFAALCPEQFRACFAAWIAEVAHCLGLKQIAIDGKTQRRSHDRGKGKAALHLISAWAIGNYLILGQEAVDQKSNDSSS